MKKRFATKWLAVGSAAALALSGCSSGTPQTETTTTAPAQTEASSEASSTAASGSSGENITLNIAWWGNQVRNDLTDQVLNLYTEENPNVTFEREFSDFSGYWNKEATLAASNSLQDVFQMNFINLPDYATTVSLWKST